MEINILSLLQLLKHTDTICDLHIHEPFRLKGKIVYLISMAKN